MALIVLMFLPWVKNASVLGVIFACKKNVDVLIFLIPISLGYIGTQIAYLISLFRPGRDAFYPGTAIVLLAGLEIFVFVLASDFAYKLVSNGEPTGNPLAFLGMTEWTIFPLIWLVGTLLQKWLLVKLAHKKKKD